MDFRTFCRDYKITTAPIGHQHNRPSWTNISCPFCVGHFGFHLGYPHNRNGNYLTCYRCGTHSLRDVIMALLNVPANQAWEIINTYGGVGELEPLRKKSWEFGRDCQLPIGAMPVNELGIKYLESRGFDAEKVIREFQLQQTGPVGQHRHRLIIPIQYKGHTVSYTCRGIIGQQVRYITCSAHREMIPSKEILYNADNARNKKAVVVVEGCTDVWRLGRGSVATFGTRFTPKQIMALAEFERVYLLQDSDFAGNNAWADLDTQLRARGARPVRMTLTECKDAGDLPDADAQYLMKTLGLQ